MALYEGRPKEVLRFKRRIFCVFFDFVLHLFSEIWPCYHIVFGLDTKTPQRVEETCGDSNVRCFGDEVSKSKTVDLDFVIEHIWENLLYSYRIGQVTKNDIIGVVIFRNIVFCEDFVDLVVLGNGTDLVENLVKNEMCDQEMAFWIFAMRLNEVVVEVKCVNVFAVLVPHKGAIGVRVAEIDNLVSFLYIHLLEDVLEDILKFAFCAFFDEDIEYGAYRMLGLVAGGCEFGGQYKFLDDSVNKSVKFKRNLLAPGHDVDEGGS